MRAWLLDDSVSPPTLFPADIPQPVPGPGELLVRVHAAGITPTELTWYPSTHTKSGEPRHHAVPGHEFSGTVAVLGPGVTTFELGDEIFGMNDWFSNGASADFCLSRPEFLAPKPRNLSHAQAASVPIGALTARQGLFDRAKLQLGEHLLVHGGSGAVGLYAIQLARLAGARITTTASARNADFLQQLGTDKVLDYRTTNFADLPANFDVIFDAVGGDTLLRSWPLLAPRGRMITIVGINPATADQRTKDAFFIVEPKSDQLADIAKKFESAELQPVVDAEIPFANANTAYANAPLKPRLSRGKLVITVSD